MAKMRNGRKAGLTYMDQDDCYQPWVARVLERKYSTFAKLLFLTVDSFGAMGCGMKNAELMRYFNCSGDTIRRAITELWRGGEFTVTGWKGSKRRLYAARHPEVLENLEDLSIDRR